MDIENKIFKYKEDLEELPRAKEDYFDAMNEAVRQIVKYEKLKKIYENSKTPTAKEELKKLKELGKDMLKEKSAIDKKIKKLM